jgi:putative flippase GtrA
VIEGSGIAEDTGAVAAPAAAGWTERVRRYYRFGRRQLRLHWTFVKFTLSGVLGYVFYQVALIAAYDIAGIEFFLSTLIAAEVSITGGFFVRDLWVFTDGPVVRRSFSTRFIQYQAKSLVSTLIVVTATVNILTSGLDVPHYISTPIGVALGFAWNWGWERGVIWRRQAP